MKRHDDIQRAARDLHTVNAAFLDGHLQDAGGFHLPWLGSFRALASEAERIRDAHGDRYNFKEAV